MCLTELKIYWRHNDKNIWKQIEVNYNFNSLYTDPKYSEKYNPYRSF